MKKDINYIKFIKPQIVKKERDNKRERIERKYETVRRIAGIEPMGIDIIEMGLWLKIIQRIKGVAP